MVFEAAGLPTSGQEMQTDWTNPCSRLRRSEAAGGQGLNQVTFLVE
jgi:hypothetical protein